MEYKGEVIVIAQIVPNSGTNRFFTGTILVQLVGVDGIART